jgi:hypothetical protein
LPKRHFTLLFHSQGAELAMKNYRKFPKVEDWLRLCSLNLILQIEYPTQIWAHMLTCPITMITTPAMMLQGFLVQHYSW